MVCVCCRWGAEGVNAAVVVGCEVEGKWRPEAEISLGNKGSLNKERGNRSYHYLFVRHYGRALKSCLGTRRKNSGEGGVKRGERLMPWLGWADRWRKRRRRFSLAAAALLPR